MRLPLAIAFTLVSTLVSCTEKPNMGGTGAAPAAKRDDSNATLGIDNGGDEKPNYVGSTKGDDASDGSEENGDDPKNETNGNPPDDKDDGDDGDDKDKSDGDLSVDDEKKDSASTTSVKDGDDGDDKDNSDGDLSVDDDMITLKRQTCVVEQYYQWQPLTIMIGSTGNSYPVSAVLQFPKDAINFEIQIIGYSVDDHSPSVSVNGTQVINVSESAKKSYNHLYPSGASISLKNLLVAGDNKFDLRAKDAYGVHAGLGLCFSGTYQATTCGSIIDRDVAAPTVKSVPGPRGGTIVTLGCGQIHN